jgi:peptidyl-tRNA hydrolase
MELNMGKGKIAAQCGHATLGAYRLAQKHCDTAVTWWQRTGQAKIAVKVEKESDLYAIAEKAKAAGLVYYQVSTDD